VVVERKFILRSASIRDHVVAYVSKAPTQPPTEVIVRPYVEKRSLEQNAMLWSWHSEAARHTGHSSEEMHEFALMRHFGSKGISVGGMSRQVPLKRSSVRNKKEFSEFMEATIAWYISELGIFLDREPQ
jgi:hypothetical protein